jgi:hypothetical protein
MISSDPKIQAQPRSTRRLAGLFNNEGGSVPECVAEIDGYAYRFIDPSWQPESGHPMHPEYQSPAWAAHEVLVLEDGGANIWRTLTEAETEDLNGYLWPEVYKAIKEWARG